MALYEIHAPFGVVTDEWKRHARALNMDATLQALPAHEPPQAHTNRVHAKIAALEARLF